MENKKIGVDLDEVLAETVDYCLEYNNYKIGEFEIKKEQITNYYIHKIKGINIELQQAIDWFNIPIENDIKKLEIKPVSGAINRILELKEAGNKIIIVTARNEERLRSYTEKWLEKYYKGLIDDIIFTDHFTDKHRHKGEVCSELGIEFMIEDNFDYALDIAKNSIQTYLLEKPWNRKIIQTHKNLKKINSWEEFKK